MFVYNKASGFDCRTLENVCEEAGGPVLTQFLAVVLLSQSQQCMMGELV